LALPEAVFERIFGFFRAIRRKNRAPIADLEIRAILSTSSRDSKKPASSGFHFAPGFRLVFVYFLTQG
jgi:hypothetical protein